MFLVFHLCHSSCVKLYINSRNDELAGNPLEALIKRNSSLTLISKAPLYGLFSSLTLVPTSDPAFVSN